MLAETETLHTIAEVGIAITGFAGIVAAIRGREDVADEASIDRPLGLLLGASLGTVFFCFVPEWLAAAIDSADVVWRASLGVYGVCRVVYVSMVVRAIQRSGVSRTPRWMVVTGLVLGVAHLFAAAGMFMDFHYFLYLSGLFWGLVISLVNFSSLLFETTPGSRSE